MLLAQTLFKAFEEIDDAWIGLMPAERPDQIALELHSLKRMVPAMLKVNESISFYTVHHFPALSSQNR